MYRLECEFEARSPCIFQKPAAVRIREIRYDSAPI